jgi:hypothetical protein
MGEPEVAEPDTAQVEAAPEAEPEAAAPEPEAAAPEPEAAAPEPQPEPEPPAPPTPLLVASSGPVSVRVESDPESGDLTVHLDDGEAPARFVRRGGAWSVE